LGDGDRDDLLDLCGESPIGKDIAAECFKAARLGTKSRRLQAISGVESG
jgi:hypothetical protein